MATDPRSDEWKHPDGNDDDTCKYCGADMKHSPCCGRLAAYGDMKESLRLEVLENDRLRQRVEELERACRWALDEMDGKPRGPGCAQALRKALTRHASKGGDAT